MLTEKQKTTNWETLKHIEIVMQLLATMQHEIAQRMFSHDRSKLQSPELEMFEVYTDKLAATTYGSEAYEQCRQEMLKTALVHHFENNRHHPEFFEHGIDDMNLIDVLEMLCDWKASTLRTADGEIGYSIEHNAKRFNLTPQLVKILKNTVPLLISAYNSSTQKHLNTYWRCQSCGAERLEGIFCPMCGVQKATEGKEND
jgi:rubrerythrin